MKNGFDTSMILVVIEEMDQYWRANLPWTGGEHSIMLCLLKDYNLPVKEVSRILKRTRGAITSRMRLVILEYHFTKKYTIEDIVSKFNFIESFVRRVINSQSYYLDNTISKKYKTCSDFAVKMDIMDAEVLASRAQNNNGLRNY